MSSPQVLAAAHLAGDSRAVAWLGQPWGGIRTAAAAARATVAQLQWRRDALAQLAPPGSAARILRDPAAVVVVAGQQPAVGGGPLLSLIKAAHALAIARRLVAEGVPAVAWFWCASEDHDLGEANHADLIRRDGTIARVVCDLGPGRAALRWRPAARWFATLAERCRQELGPGPGAAWLAGLAPEDGEGMGAWQCRLLHRLWADRGLVAVEAHALRGLWAERIAPAVAGWPAAALAARAAELAAAGYEPAFGALAAPPFFLDRPDGRTAIAAVDAASAPAADLSPGAALRPVLQQFALPAAVAVLGPAELAYHAAIGPAYAALGAPRPLLVPRCSLTLLPAWTARAAARLGLAPEALADGAAPEPRPLPGQRPERLAAVARAIAELGDPADRRIAAAQTRLRRELDRLAASLARGDRAAAGLPAPGAIAAWLHPRGRRQERTLSVFQAIWDHGPGLADALLAAAEAAAPGEHRLVRL